MSIDLDAIQAPLPEDARMDAYYYGFDRTGVGIVDAILSAVAIAGKGSHHTESWGEDSEFGYYKNRPGLPDADNAVDLIQSAADLAARNTTALLAYARDLEARLGRVEALAYNTPPFASGNNSTPDSGFVPVRNLRAALTATEGQA